MGHIPWGRESNPWPRDIVIKSGDTLSKGGLEKIASSGCSL